jgi:hypothetical protein
MKRSPDTLRRALVLIRLQTTRANHTMPLTNDFSETVRARLSKSAGFRKAVLQEVVDGLLAGDLDSGTALLRDYVNGTMGFERLSEPTQIPAKSLMRMLGPNGHLQARHLLDVLAHLQRAEGVRFEVSLKSQAGVPAA